MRSLNLTLSLVLSLAFSSVLAQQPQVFDRPAATNENWTTGPEIGERIPDFTGVDHNGVVQSFEDIKGPNGAYIIFQRSADW